ncbi:hypothetical protein Drose_15610 [Dactylosporangium roseum]|uniref:Uncharacterized protein n=1 Tax=Dactylosporangium roseum TaxID=47989 RepID=A0ABY5ZBQ9_9ACTN|nr:hypothetical protein [Dactylosporangium roseum]UWZ39530.1 hypothetical protein Drose_15610 [Dactylosporangium roseum]
MRPQDHAYEILLRGAIPFVLAPVDASPRTRRLRGVVRVDQDQARVVFTDDAAMTRGVAFEISLLTGDDPGADMWAALGRLRALAAEEWASDTRDSHHNVIIDAATAGDRPAELHDQALYGLFSTFFGAGGIPWYTDIYTFAGFMRVSEHQTRVYLRDERDAITYGVQVPRRSGYGSLPQELAPLIRERQLQFQPLVDDTDDYGSPVYDLTAFTGPG